MFEKFVPERYFNLLP